MLSILIPTYNYNAFPLAETIEKQALKSGLVFELICIDDGSNSLLNIENEKINHLTNCKFIAKKNNVGLSNNRNALAKLSNYEYILFIDGDSMLTSNKFITNYLDAIDRSFDIIYGGRIHPNFIENPNKKLRCKYGKFIEDKTVSNRNKNVYKTLMFNNTLIKKECFNDILFDSSLKKYGHEDTLFAYHVSLANLNVKHIDNPIEHTDIDISSVFIKKTEDGLVNLLHLYYSKKINNEFVRILKLYILINKVRLNSCVSFLYRIFNSVIKKQLESFNPSLTLFKLYKIGFLCSLKKEVI